MAIVYQHRRKDTNSIFYIGIGKNESRAFSKNSRSLYWKNIALRVGFEVDILFKGISWSDACNVEIGMIDSYGRKDLGFGELVNMTSGGDGVVGNVISDTTRNKMINSKKNMSIETRDKMRRSRLGKKSAKETIVKLSSINSGHRNSMARKVINLETSEIYKCAKEAALLINVKENTFRQWLRGERKNKTNFKYL
jgi:hypothetical protein